MPYPMSGAREFSMAVVGGAFPNADGSNRMFEIAMCSPGEPVALVLDPRNKVDPSAVAVISARGIQIGNLSADRCGWIGGKMRLGEEVIAIFQEAFATSAAIRMRLGGGEPTLPTKRKPAPAAAPEGEDFYPDYDPPYD